MEKTFTTVAAISVALIAGGCSSTPGNEFKSRSGTQEYDRTVAIASDLRASGQPCSKYSISDVATYARESATCALESHDVILSVFDSSKDMDANIRNFADMYGSIRLQYGLLVGSKWIINCGDTTRWATCENLQSKLGGEIVKSNYT
ncbi:hypothetical protein B2J88_35770 [Rhodococcus sp. SRB_17]|nr:hypothetical protein [Rhodococcus sp. SRB_17]